MRQNARFWAAWKYNPRTKTLGLAGKSCSYCRNKNENNSDSLNDIFGELRSLVILKPFSPKKGIPLSYYASKIKKEGDIPPVARLLTSSKTSTGIPPPLEAGPTAALPNLPRSTTVGIQKMWIPMVSTFPILTSQRSPLFHTSINGRSIYLAHILTPNGHYISVWSGIHGLLTSSKTKFPSTSTDRSPQPEDRQPHRRWIFAIDVYPRALLLGWSVDPKIQRRSIEDRQKVHRRSK